MNPHPIDPSRDESYSQWGEDRLVWEFFEGRTDGFFLEAGAYHPVQLSQTCLLEKRGWHGVLVEPLPDNAQAFADQRPNSRLVTMALGDPGQAGEELTFVVPDGETSLARLLEPGEAVPEGERVSRVPLTTLTRVLDESEATRLNYLSLDLEGYELPALRGLDFERWRPDLIVIEDRVENLDQHRFLWSQGFHLVYRTGSNNWYVPAGTRFPRHTLWMRLKLLRKMYLSMPFRKLRQAMKRANHRHTTTP